MSVNTISNIKNAIKKHPQNKGMGKKGYEPLFSAHPAAKIIIIGQAPGAKTHEANAPWADQSGEQLRRWLGVTDEVFYDESKIALMPMDFYFPGKGKTGDLPPRKGFAELWHPQLFDLMPNIKLTILIGNYSQSYYLENRAKTLTETVQNYKMYLKDGFFPLPHPSPRNNIWKKKNPWFEAKTVPALQKIIKRSI